MEKLLKLLKHIIKKDYNGKFFRRVKGGGLDITQIIGFKNVYSLSSNSSRFNGEIHGDFYHILIKKDTGFNKKANYFII